MRVSVQNMSRGCIIVNTKPIDCVASYYGYSEWGKNTEFVVKYISNNDIGVQPIINGEVVPNVYGAGNCLWFSSRRWKHLSLKNRIYLGGE